MFDPDFWRICSFVFMPFYCIFCIFNFLASTLAFSMKFSEFCQTFFPNSVNFFSFPYREKLESLYMLFLDTSENLRFYQLQKS